MEQVNKTIITMLQENTGKHFLDSGGIYGRHWERNERTTFESETPVTYEIWQDEVEYTISVYHYLINAGLSFDTVCNEFNRLQDQSENWDADTECYGVSSEAWDYLESQFDATVENVFNTYNGDSNLSQVLQGAYLDIDQDKYVLIQVHGGCDVRGGYTDAKLFKLDNWDEYLPSENVYGEIDGIQVDNMHNGYSLTDEDGEKVPCRDGSHIILELMNN